MASWRLTPPKKGICLATVGIAGHLPFLGGVFRMAGDGIKNLGSGLDAIGDNVNRGIDEKVNGISLKALPDNTSNQSYLDKYINELKLRIATFSKTAEGQLIGNYEKIQRRKVVHATYSHVQVPTTPYQSIYAEWGSVMILALVGLSVYNIGLKPFNALFFGMQSVLKLGIGIFQSITSIFHKKDNPVSTQSKKEISKNSNQLNDQQLKEKKELQDQLDELTKSRQKKE